MQVKLFLSASKISQKEFEGTKPGYDALQVDSFLDIVIKDYENMEKYILDSQEEINNLNNKVTMLTNNLSKMEAQVSIYEKKIKDYSETKANAENIDLLKRISALEKALGKLGVNPSMIEDK